MIAIDFDGTVVQHAYPEVGPSIGAEGVLKEIVARGHRLILFTMRSGRGLYDAVDWFDRNGIELWAVNDNPEQAAWTSSRKVWARVYIDDCALGCPLKSDFPGARGYVDWERVRLILEQQGIL